MAFDGFVLNAVVSELKDCLIDGKIQKIYEPNSNEILLGIYSAGIQYALSINTSSNLYSVYLTTTKKENPLSAPNFCMLLRKHLMGFRITNITTLQFERIMIIELSGNDEFKEIVDKKLVIELMGKHSNILLLDNKNIIIDSLKHFSIKDGAYRDIMPKFEYTLPTSDKTDISNYSSFENELETSNFPAFFMSHFTGISKSLIESVIHNLSLSNDINKENYIAISKYLLELKSKIAIKQVNCEPFQNDYVLSICNSSYQNLQINNFLDIYYSQKEQDEQFLLYRNQLLNFILGRLKKISKKLSTIDDKLKECNEMEKYKLYGELITSHLYEISKEHIDNITLPNYYNQNEAINIPLDIAISPSENAKKYFKKYHKLKNTFAIVQDQKIDLEKEINYLESIVYELQSSNSIKELDGIYDEIQDSFSNSQKNTNKKQLKKKKTKRENKLIDPICYNVENFKVLVGKNNKQNDELTFKIANKEDIWFHVKDIHGSHVILVTNGKTPTQELINQVASIAAYHSKGFQSSNVSVDYTFVKYVKKPNKSKPGMVTYTNQQTVTVKPKNMLPPG